LRGGNPWGTNLEDWLSKIGKWSKNHKGHAPITVFLDIKKNLIDDNNKPPEYFGLIRLNEQIINAIGRDRLFTPDDLKNHLKEKRERGENNPHPTIKDLEDRIIIVLMSFHFDTEEKEKEEIKNRSPWIKVKKWCERQIRKGVSRFKKWVEDLGIAGPGAMKTRIWYQEKRVVSRRKKKGVILYKENKRICFVAFGPKDLEEKDYEPSLEEKSIFATPYKDELKKFNYQSIGKLVRTDYIKEIKENPEKKKRSLLRRIIGKIDTFFTGIDQEIGRYGSFGNFPDSVNFPATDHWIDYKDGLSYHDKSKDWVRDKWMECFMQ
jgi:hypothetical protein